jgi:hypothetical protein
MQRSLPDVPPTHTIAPMEPPPDSDRPNVMQLKGDIDSGATGDKIGVFDPGLSPLGTDDEAAGTPPKPEQVAAARRFETFGRWVRGGRPKGYVHRKRDPALEGFLGLIAVLAVVLSVGVAWVR